MMDRFIQVSNRAGKYSIKWEHVAGIQEIGEDACLMLKDGTLIYIDNIYVEKIKRCLGEHV